MLREHLQRAPVGALAHVPGTDTRGADDDRVAETGALDGVAQHVLGDRRAADVARADGGHA